MAIIRDGFGSKPLHIDVQSRDESTTIELWTEMYDDTKSKQHFATLKEGETHDPDDVRFRTRILHFMTIHEAIALRDEINNAIKRAAGV